MEWILFVTTLPVVGQGVGANDLILVGWQQTTTQAASYRLMATADALNAFANSDNPPTYWYQIAAVPAPQFTATATDQQNALQAAIASVTAAGGDATALQAALNTVQATATTSLPVNTAAPATT